MRYLIILFSLVLTSCSETILEPVYPSPTHDEHPIKLVWKKRMYPNDSINVQYTTEPLLWGGKIIYNSQGSSGPPSIIARSISDGTYDWEWTGPDLRNLARTRAVYVSEDDYIFTDQHRIYKVDLQNQSHSSVRRLDYNSPRMSVFKGLVMNVNGDAPSASSKSILSIYYQSDLSFYREFTVLQENGFSPGIQPPIGDINLGGDTILYFVCRFVNFSMGGIRADVYAYNVSKDSVVWHKKDIFPTGNTSVYAPLQDNDYIYVPGQETPICIRKSDGKIMWKTQLPSGFLDCNHVLHEGRLYLVGQDEKFFALDAATGKQVWGINDESYNCTQMALYNNRLYYTSSGTGKLYCVDIASRKLLWAYDSPQDDGWSNVGFWHGLIIDQSTGYLYTADGRYMMCIDLNKIE